MSDVFVRSYLMEKDGHLGEFWSDDQRFSFCRCSCGWSNDTPSAQGMVNLWRGHFDAMTPTCRQENTR